MMSATVRPLVLHRRTSEAGARLVIEALPTARGDRWQLRIEQVSAMGLRSVLDLGPADVEVLRLELDRLARFTPEPHASDEATP